MRTLAIENLFNYSVKPRIEVSTYNTTEIMNVVSGITSMKNTTGTYYYFIDYNQKDLFMTKSDGTFITALELPDTRAAVSSVLASDQHIYLTDRSDTIYRFDFNLNAETKFNICQSASVCPSKLAGMAFDSATGKLYVADSGLFKVFVFNANALSGLEASIISLNSAFSPYSIALFNGKMYVGTHSCVDVYTNGVLVENYLNLCETRYPLYTLDIVADGYFVYVCSTRYSIRLKTPTGIYTLPVPYQPLAAHVDADQHLVVSQVFAPVYIYY